MYLLFIEPISVSSLLPYFIVEAVLIIVNMFLFAAMIYVSLLVQIHVNLKVLTISGIIQYYPALFGRLIILAYQSHLTENGPQSELIIAVCSFFRTYHIALILSFPLWLFIERFLAHRFISDYERNPRKWIAFILIIVSAVYATTATLLLLFEVFCWEIVGGVTFLGGYIGAMLFFVLKKRTERLNQLIKKNYSTPSLPYSLSLRFQLQENMHSTTIIRNVFLTLGLINTTSFVCYIVGNTGITRNQIDPFTLQILDCVFNLNIATSGPIIAVGVFMYNSYMKHLVKKTFFGITDEIPSEKGDVYFLRLDQQWEDQFQKKEIK